MLFFAGLVKKIIKTVGGGSYTITFTGGPIVLTNLGDSKDVVWNTSLGNWIPFNAV
jgi:hypothetical protein